MEKLTKEQRVELLQNFVDWLNIEYNGPDVPVEIIEEYLEIIINKKVASY